MPKKGNAPSVVPRCHPDRRHVAHGLCKSCYDRSYVAINRVATNARKVVWAQSNRARVGVIRRRYRYGIEPDQYQAKLNAQDGLCKICNSRPASHVDHDHKTKMVRSILCGDCNRALGLFLENPEVLQRAIAYLELWNTGAIKDCRQ